MKPVSKPVLYHSPRSRSSAIVTLLDELGARDKVDIRIVSIPRHDGSGRRDGANPHPDGKVPFLVNGDDVVHERAAIVAYLTELFPQNRLGPMPGEANRGRYLTWLAYYQGTLEPLVVMSFTGVQHPAIHATFRTLDDVAAKLKAALSRGPWLLGEHYSGADLLMHGAYVFMPSLMPDDALIQDWVKRCSERPSVQRTAAFDAEAMQSLA